jgi:hypothetical protein
MKLAVIVLLVLLVSSTAGASVYYMATKTSNNDINQTRYPFFPLFKLK